MKEGRVKDGMKEGVGGIDLVSSIGLHIFFPSLTDSGRDSPRSLARNAQAHSHKYQPFYLSVYVCVCGVCVHWR